jgi:hypothetical protein
VLGRIPSKGETANPLMQKIGPETCRLQGRPAEFYSAIRWLVCNSKWRDRLEFAAVGPGNLASFFVSRMAKPATRPPAARRRRAAAPARHRRRIR